MWIKYNQACHGTWIWGNKYRGLWVLDQDNIDPMLNRNILERNSSGSCYESRAHYSTETPKYKGAVEKNSTDQICEVFKMGWKIHWGQSKNNPVFVLLLWLSVWEKCLYLDLPVLSQWRGRFDSQTWFCRLIIASCSAGYQAFISSTSLFQISAW